MSRDEMAERHRVSKGKLHRILEREPADMCRGGFL